MDYKKLIVERIKEHLEVDDIESLIEIPPNPEMGDFTFPCFRLSKINKKAPNIIARDLQGKINKAGFEKIKNLGPYVNFFIDKVEFNKSTIEQILEEGDSYGASSTGKGKNVIVEYSSPNIAKQFHIGHLFTTAIGHSLYRMLKFQGYNPIGVNHLGDWGNQFGKLISAYKRWGNKEDLHKEPINELLRIYIKFHHEVDNKPELENEGRMYFKKLEEGDEEITELWQIFKNLSLKEFNNIYSMLGIDFDSWLGDSFYNNKIEGVVKELESKNILIESNGARVVMFNEYVMPPCIVIKSDGTSMYAIRDLAAAIYRKKTYNFYKCIYVVGKDQILHFNQVFKTLELTGKEWAKDCIHVSFGLVKFSDRKLSTRKGNILLAQDLLNEAVARTLEIINKKNTSLEQKEEIAKKVGIGAVLFTYLKNYRERDIIFDWKEILSFENENGLYVQYSYIRAMSILRKYNNVTVEADFSKLNSKEEFELVKVLKDFQRVILLGIDKLEPSVVARYSLDVAKAFNKFYNRHSVLYQEDIGLKAARIKLIKATAQVVKNALYLIGINVVEKM